MQLLGLSASHPLCALPLSYATSRADPFTLDPRTAGFLLHLTKERQEMGGWEEERGQPQVALPVGSTFSVAPDPTGQAHQDSSFLPLTQN